MGKKKRPMSRLDSIQGFAGTIIEINQKATFEGLSGAMKKSSRLYEPRFLSYEPDCLSEKQSADCFYVENAYLHGFRWHITRVT